MSIVDNPPVFIALNATLFALAYLIPTFVALTRQRNQRLKIFVVNLLTGWTLIGWMVAFIWAISLPWDIGRHRAGSRRRRRVDPAR
ncbi:superinfection immunity protein [Rhodobaculum claviforme]|uniref:Superinfection immunity protein n=1 Tax=Rhodobaculum claviforme TaxID=1549854 RepID=A0A934TLI0_9RHOB|nr:superinfection immunity protein [Rhodobaculum claviforme]MBK5928030.1 hypothetical protein [Rhodobaculum claviforme]